ncbi:MAG: hypothetical protein JW828_06845 [Sedimentisphaerales bacterium]|nr:hypothetical protein [Sedimentisphaerales bacterium]
MCAEHVHSHGIPCGCCMSRAAFALNRRQFMTGVGAGLAAPALAASVLAQVKRPSDIPLFKAPAPRPLVIQPVLTVTLFQRHHQTSWRSWGGIHTEEDIRQEQKRIGEELAKIQADSEFAMEVRPLVTLNDPAKAAELAKGDHDIMLIYAANAWLNVLENLTNPNKWTMVFVRHKSGPVYLWYEIAHNRYLRKTVDQYGQPGVDYQDVVVDRLDELQWRFRALYGLKNTLGKRIVAVGGPSGWGEGGQKAPEITKNLWKMDLRTLEYKDLGEMIKKARANQILVNYCNACAEQFLKRQGITLETEPAFVRNAFLLTEVFKDVMHQHQTDSITINHCMGTIMPISETTACLPLMLLNDEGYQAYCESDFVVIPSGILLHHMSSQPVFLNDPTYPHDNVVTMAHCTAPSKMDGKNYESVRILTHFESDYGAAPKVAMKVGQTMTVIDPDFDAKVWLGFEAEVIDNPFLDICRSQTDIHIKGDCETLVAQTRGFHWMASYGNYLRETGYALKKVGIAWNNLSKKA